MPLGVWTAPSTWAPAKTVHVWNGSVWQRAKKMKVWTGSAWVLAWVHPVVNATISLSKTGVGINEAYDVTMTVPDGFPEGATVEGRFTGYSTGVVAMTEGVTSVSLPGVAHATAGTYAWYADVTTKGGNTTFGPVTQSVAAVSSTTVTLTAPAWVLSTQSGAGGSDSIAARTYTINLSNPAIVSRLSIQFSDNGGAWTEYASWDSPAATVNYSVVATTSAGTLRVRAVATQTNAAIVYSTEATVAVYVKNLVAAASDTSLNVNQVLTLTASYSGNNVGATTGYWDYMLTADGIWHLNLSAANPYTWSSAGVQDINWRWRETYPDGSTIISNVVRTIVATHYHVTVASGASAATIQNAMDAARTWWLANKNIAVNFDDENTFACVELAASGSYNLGSTELHARRGVRLVGGGSGGTRPLVTCSGGHFMRCSSNGGGGYNNPDYDWIVHNIRINCNAVTGGFSIVHTKRFRISNCYFYNLGPIKHYIEVNSSGNVRSDGTSNVQILNNEFTNSVNISGRRVEDECVQMDYSWNGAAYNTANDGTITNNVLIDGNNFHDAPRAIGSHHFQASGGAPDNFHANIVIRNNTFTNIDPSQFNGGDAPNKVSSEGAVRAYGWENVSILNNVFDSCFQPVCIYIPGDCPTGFGDPDFFHISGNYLRDVVQDRYGIFGTSAHATLKFRRVLIENNIADQTWDTSPDIYFAGIDDTRGAWSGYTQGAIIRNNQFRPTNYDAAGEKAYNKYRAANTSNETGILITGNTVSDGTVDNS